MNEIYEKRENNCEVCDKHVDAAELAKHDFSHKGFSVERKKKRKRQRMGDKIKVKRKREWKKKQQEIRKEKRKKVGLRLYKQPAL